METEPYRIQLRGPGLDSCLELRDEDDLAILDAMLEKIRAALRSKEPA